MAFSHFHGVAVNNSGLFMMNNIVLKIFLICYIFIILCIMEILAIYVMNVYIVEIIYMGKGLDLHFELHYFQYIW